MLRCGPQASLEDDETGDRNDPVLILRSFRKFKPECRSENDYKKAEPTNCQTNSVAERIERALDSRDPHRFNRSGNHGIRNETEGDDTGVKGQ